MDYLPITSYHIGQPIQIGGDISQRSIIAELSQTHIGLYREHNGGQLPVIERMTPDFVKPVIRPIKQIRISHVIGLFKVNNPDSDFTDDQIISFMNQNTDLIEIYADSLAGLMYLMNKNYDLFGWIEKGLAVDEEE